MSTVMRWIASARASLNLGLLLGIFFFSGAALVALNSVLLFRFADRHLSELCANLRETYDAGGQPALRVALRTSEVQGGALIQLVDAQGRDLASGRRVAAPSRGGIRVAAGKYACVLTPPSASPPMPLGPMWWVLPFVSVLCCSVGAYVARRMRKIESVVKQFASGELAARLPSAPGDAIGRMCRAFNDMAEQVQTQIASQQQLCTDMAHELRSPLTRLLLALRVAANTGNGALSQVEKEAHRMNELIEQLLEVARAESDRSYLDLEALDIESLLTEIADHCRIEAVERACDIDLVASDSGSVTGDSELLRRAVENVLRNAIRHSPEGKPIQVWSRGESAWVTIAIRDWGPGVPDAALSGIFRPFYRVDSARARDSGGVGLGLSIAQRALMLHGGSIHAENCAPGLRVVMRIPREQEAQPAFTKLKVDRAPCRV